MKQGKAWKQKAFAKTNGKERKKEKIALCKQTALDKAANSIKYASTIYSIMYKRIKIGRQSWLVNLTLFFFYLFLLYIHINAFLRKAINKAVTRQNHTHIYSDHVESSVFVI